MYFHTTQCTLWTFLAHCRPNKDCLGLVLQKILEKYFHFNISLTFSLAMEMQSLSLSLSNAEGGNHTKIASIDGISFYFAEDVFKYVRKMSLISSGIDKKCQDWIWIWVNLKIISWKVKLIGKIFPRTLSEMIMMAWWAQYVWESWVHYQLQPREVNSCVDKRNTVLYLYSSTTQLVSIYLLTEVGLCSLRFIVPSFIVMRWGEARCSYIHWGITGESTDCKLVLWMNQISTFADIWIFGAQCSPGGYYIWVVVLFISPSAVWLQNIILHTFQPVQSLSLLSGWPTPVTFIFYIISPPSQSLSKQIFKIFYLNFYLFVGDDKSQPGEFN